MGVAVAVEAFYRHDVLDHSARKPLEQLLPLQSLPIAFYTNSCQALSQGTTRKYYWCHV